jgi:5-oxoprolinase (ATP-hydrolysing)
MSPAAAESDYASAASNGLSEAFPAVSQGQWQFWIDRGGTFTDIVAQKPDGRVVTHKLLSDNPGRYADAALHGIREIMGLGATAPIPSERIAAVKMGTTVATNALLERTGDRTLLVVTKGFADALRIGYQNRPRLFDRHIVLPEMLYESVLEVPERVTAEGETLRTLDVAAARAGLQKAHDAGFRACAIVFMHGYRYPAHEAAVAEMAREVGFSQVSTSHATSPLMKLISRGDTTVVDAYLSPILRRYVDRVAAALRHTRLLFMQSNGGLTEAGRFQGKDAILSGPAGGVVGMVRTAGMAGFKKIIGFDMGGTSTDVSHYDGVYERTFESAVAGVRLRAPMMAIHTVAAGGGSLCTFDAGRFRVGPESAGANPGPMSYRRGGPLTVTDCNVVLGRLQPDHFPAVFGPRGDQPLDAEAPRAAFAALAAEIGIAAEEVAEGFLRIAVENMANAIKRISVQRGYAIDAYVLACFGGAGGQHACRVADALGMDTVFLHPFAGVLSAYGMGLADLRAMRQRAMEVTLDPAALRACDFAVGDLESEARDALLGQGVLETNIRVLRHAHLRYQGTDTPLAVPLDGAEAMRRAFEEAHHRRYGFASGDRPLVVEAISVEAIGKTSHVDDPLVVRPGDAAPPSPIDTVRACFAGQWVDTPVHDRAALNVDDVIDGPAIVVEPTGTTVIEPGWAGQVTNRAHLVLRRVAPRPVRESVGTTADPVMLEVFNNLFMSIAEQMGATLRNTAHSVNIKERLDFSCAVFDAAGNLVANAPHMPVHLGSMGESVRAVLRDKGQILRPGDVYALNAPYNGGTHLPDVTVVTPVFDAAGAEILFFVASRGHHADIGGVTPGSMPPFSTTVEDEGVLLDGVPLVRDGRFQEADIRALLGHGRHPARNPDQNVADLRAQVAANTTGQRELMKMVGHFGLDVVRAYMGHVQDNAEASVRQVIGSLRRGSFSYEMDDGSQIVVSVSVDADRRAATVDFTGTSEQQTSNFNAPAAVTRAAVLYVFRTLVEAPIPMNEGCLKPIEIILPKDCMLNPTYPAAVVAGNVETSQAVVDALYGALGVMAASQGTMNNFTFGNDTYQYYETICGGSGAGPDFDGTDAVHTHMTNSRLTDPEVLEWRFPVLLEDFSIRRGSGGEGRHKGGDGVVRRLRFLEPMTAAILANRRRVAPYGLAGGRPGQGGRTYVLRKDGAVKDLRSVDQVEMEAEDVFVIETPGGGGYGAA